MRIFSSAIIAITISVFSITPGQAANLATASEAFQVELEQAESIYRSLKGGERNHLNKPGVRQRVVMLLDRSRDQHAAGQKADASSSLCEAQQLLKIRFDCE